MVIFVGTNGIGNVGGMFRNDKGSSNCPITTKADWLGQRLFQEIIGLAFFVYCSYIKAAAAVIKHKHFPSHT